MQVRVNLPPGSLIDYLAFCEAIAQAVCPTNEHGPKGIDCIVAKREIRHVPITPHHVGEWQSVLISADGRTLDQLVSSGQSASAATGELELPLTEPEYPCYQVGELSGQFNLTDDDRRTLEKLLPKLPPLRSPMSEDEVAAFMDAYLRLPDHPAWEPVLISATTIENREMEHGAIKRHHQQMLQDELACGRLVAVNHNHIRVATLGAGYFIPRSQAIAYLERYGFAYRDGIPDETMVQRSIPEHVGSVVTTRTVLANGQGSEVLRPQGDPAANEFSQEVVGRSERCMQQSEKPAPSDAVNATDIPNADTTSQPLSEGTASTARTTGDEWSDTKLRELFYCYEQHGAPTTREEYGVGRTRLYVLIERCEKKFGVESKRKKKVGAKKRGAKAWPGQ